MIQIEIDDEGLFPVLIFEGDFRWNHCLMLIAAVPDELQSALFDNKESDFSGSLSANSELGPRLIVFDSPSPRVLHSKVGFGQIRL